MGASHFSFGMCFKKGHTMGITLSEKEITDFESCVRREILTYVRYPEYGSRCFAYPQFRISGNELEVLTKSAFPDDGCLPMAVVGVSNADLKGMYGTIVVMTVNDDELSDNRNYGVSEQSRYNGVIDPNRQRSIIEFSKLSKHSLSSALMQIVDVDGQIDFSKPQDEPVRLYADQAEPQTKYILIPQVQGAKKKFYGPFEYSVDGDKMHIKASGDFKMMVAALNESTFSPIELVDEEGYITAQFVDAEEYTRKFGDCADRYDWISDEELLDALGRISREGETQLSKNQMRNLKNDLKRCNDQKIELTDARRERMLKLVTSYEDWAALPEEIKSRSVESIPPRALADYVLSSEYFKSFYPKVIENDQVKEKVEQEKAKYTSQIDDIRAELRDLESDRAAAKAELDGFDTELEARRADLEKEVEGATKAAREEKELLSSECVQLRDELQTLQEDKILVERQIRQKVQEMSDEVTVANKILENEMIKQIVASVSSPAPDVHEETTESPDVEQKPVCVRDFSFAEGMEELTGSQVIDIVEQAVCEKAGRDFTRNDIINFMICLSQGYITTFAGLPGTGKTSLANILAGALGLKNSDVGRFVEVAVERGWTSFKDFIGYYNPLTKTMEKSVAEVYDAFEELDGEAQSGLDGAHVPPMVMLLDEANLSSIEHYWSPFLRACDKEGSKTISLSLGGSDSFSVPPYLRFMATVNFDHTTEELSPRFLDRSWVITLEADRLDFAGGDAAVRAFDFSKTEPLSYAKLQEVFGVRADAMMKPDSQAKLKEVLDIFAKHQHPVSPRSQRMMWDYVCVAETLMDLGSADAAYAPVDYAVAQKVLPTISGAEQSLEELLGDLVKVSGLPHTKRRVERMLRMGSDSGFFQYFA